MNSSKIIIGVPQPTLSIINISNFKRKIELPLCIWVCCNNNMLHFIIIILFPYNILGEIKYWRQSVTLGDKNQWESARSKITKTKVRTNVKYWGSRSESHLYLIGSNFRAAFDSSFIDSVCVFLCSNVLSKPYDFLALNLNLFRRTGL